MWRGFFSPYNHPNYGAHRLDSALCEGGSPISTDVSRAKIVDIQFAVWPFAFKPRCR
jgi:hypothetical protein